VVVPTDRGPLTVVATHLNPFSGPRRLREAGRLVARFARPGELVLLMGDLNSLDPESAHEERLARLSAVYRQRHLHAGAGGRSVADTRTVARLVAAGFVDLWRAGGCAGPDTTAPTAEGGGAEFSGMRLDYVLGTARTVPLLRGCRTVTGDESEYASDHYPVVADLDLSFR
jgi:endonuclease/exonuclease/phosphatase family metal-dependent hydrolase